MIERGDVIFDQVPTHILSGSCPLLITDNSHIDDSQHVSDNFSPSHYNVNPPLNPMSVSSSNPFTVTGQTNVY